MGPRGGAAGLCPCDIDGNPSLGGGLQWQPGQNWWPRALEIEAKRLWGVVYWCPKQMEWQRWGGP